MAKTTSFLLRDAQEWMAAGQISRLEAQLDAVARSGPLPAKMAESIALAAIQGGHDDALAAILARQPQKFGAALLALGEEAAARESRSACLLLVDAGLDPNFAFLLLGRRRWLSEGIPAHEQEREGARPRLWTRASRWGSLAQSLMQWAVEKQEEASDPDAESAEPPLAFARALAARGGQMPPALWVSAMARHGLAAVDWMAESGADLFAPHPLRGAKGSGLPGGDAPTGNALEAWLRTALLSRKVTPAEWLAARAGIEKLARAGGGKIWAPLSDQSPVEPVHLLWTLAGRASAGAAWAKSEESISQSEALMAWLLRQADASRPDAHGRQVVHHAMGGDVCEGEKDWLGEAVTPLMRAAMLACPFGWLAAQTQRLAGHPDEKTAQEIFAQRERNELLRAGAAAGGSIEGIQEMPLAEENRWIKKEQPPKAAAVHPKARRRRI